MGAHAKAWGHHMEHHPEPCHLPLHHLPAQSPTAHRHPHNSPAEGLASSPPAALLLPLSTSHQVISLSICTQRSPPSDLTRTALCYCWRQAKLESDGGCAVVHLCFPGVQVAGLRPLPLQLALNHA